MALYHLCAASPAFCSETFDRLCVAMLHARGEAAVLAALDQLYTGGIPEGLAATYLTNVSPRNCGDFEGSPCNSACPAEGPLWEALASLARLCAGKLGWSINLRSPPVSKI